MYFNRKLVLAVYASIKKTLKYPVTDLFSKTKGVRQETEAAWYEILRTRNFEEKKLK